ncbi:MAG: 50S ribosomal protein L25/general stress protein Ctc [Gammaproteobacteria bacterium AqS3]|nr:50S ribosomal protein L25/general stress protein Ctc [Gammaproteobacteria bacterium AqS3]
MISLKASIRSDLGSRASRRLRRIEDQVPAVVYGGADETPVQHISLTHNALLLALQAESFYTQPIELEIDGAATQVILKGLQRHPYKQRILHADFLRASGDTVLKMQVPVRCINQELCQGVKQGDGMIELVQAQIEVSGRVRDIPEYIEVDVEPLDVGESIKLSEIQLPRGIELTALGDGTDETRDQTVVHVIKQRKSAEAAAAEGAAVEGEAAGAEGTEGGESS